MPGDVQRLRPLSQQATSRAGNHAAQPLATDPRSPFGQDAALGHDKAALPALPLASQLPAGRLVELAGDRNSCQMTQAVACLRQAQLRGETCAWVQPEGGSLFPPDLADSGVDLRALVVVHVPRSARLPGLAKAAELMLRSGGFGMVVIDLWDSRLEPHAVSHAAWQGRLFGMAREHHSHVLLLSPGEQSAMAPRTRHTSPRSYSARSASLGPLIGLRLRAQRTRIEVGRFALTTQVLKDKSGSLGALAEEHRRGPWGFR